MHIDQVAQGCADDRQVLRQLRGLPEILLLRERRECLQAGNDRGLPGSRDGIAGQQHARFQRLEQQRRPKQAILVARRTPRGGRIVPVVEPTQQRGQRNGAKQPLVETHDGSGQRKAFQLHAQYPMT
jgi:hypothetical protein